MARGFSQRWQKRRSAILNFCSAIFLNIDFFGSWLDTNICHVTVPPQICFRVTVCSHKDDVSTKDPKKFRRPLDSFSMCRPSGHMDDVPAKCTIQAMWPNHLIFLIHIFLPVSSFSYFSPFFHTNQCWRSSEGIVRLSQNVGVFYGSYLQPFQVHQ